MADVFISYARQDEAVARRVGKALQDGGLDVWWDEQLPAHRSYSDVIEAKLEQARVVIVLWSAAAAKSQWVRAEADFARNRGKLVQALLDENLPPLPFNQIQCADLKGWRGNRKHRGWLKLSESVKSVLSGVPSEEAGPSKPSGAKAVGRRGLFAGLAAVVAALAAIFFFAPQLVEREETPKVAVLPFRSLNAQDASLVAGIWEDTRTAIGRNPQLVVLGPNTAQQLAEKGEDAIKKAADYLVEASVRTAGDRIRVSAGLVRTSDGQQLWSQQFDRKLDDVFALQTEVAREIEGRIRGRLATKGGKTPEHIATSGDLYALYSDARAKIRKRDFTLYKSAYDELQQVVKADPNFAPAWAALAFLGRMTPPSQKGWDTTDPSEAYARKAVELAPNLAAAHAALAFALDLRGPVARAEIEKAIELDPSDYEAVLWLGNMRSGDGDRKGAIEAYTRALQIEPLFWPAVLNVYAAYKADGDEEGIKRVIEEQHRLGNYSLEASVQLLNLREKGEVAEAINLGLNYLTKSKEDSGAVIKTTVWDSLLQLGFLDEAYQFGGAPVFAPLLWRNDPKGLDMMESQGIKPRTFFALSPLTENAGRVYMLTGRSRRFVDLFHEAGLTPAEFRKLSDDQVHFLVVAPMLAVALRENGQGAEAADMLAVARSEANLALSTNDPTAQALAARVAAVDGRKDEALRQLSTAVNRGWLPAPPQLLTDLALDPALTSLKGDARFEQLRQRVLATIARERAQVNAGLLKQVSSL